MKALFLDRDGVINQRLPGAYVTKPSELHILDKVAEALHVLKEKYELVLLVTNQQGIGKKLMTHEQLKLVHETMEKGLQFTFDRIYYCPYLAEYRPFCRKPQPGMAYQAQKDFPEIDFLQSTMVGDMESDMQFAQAMGMTAIQITTGQVSTLADAHYPSLYAFANEYSG